MKNLKDKYIMITGSSRGIGATIAQHLAKLEAKVAITYSSSSDSAQQVFQSLEGKEHLLLQMDVTNSESIKNAFDKFMEHFSTLSALVNNAGITKDGLLLRMQDKDFDSVLKTNLYGNFYCAREAAKYMIKARQGHIINISSVVAQIGNPGQANYVASKAGIEGLTRTMANELAGRNIQVNAIAPGFIKTNMTEQLNVKQVQAITDRIPLKKLGHPQDIAETVAFLLSSSYITGQVISVNGGLAM
ncbi:MAG: 3-oxoacyl-[acyl-carrier-protein] reductase [Bdellovibrionales bacterium]|nr:3-oxoacyl-[acyl-carrier-protein] reductase [Bdellovibrionales bacterium]